MNLSPNSAELEPHAITLQLTPEERCRSQDKNLNGRTANRCQLIHFQLLILTCTYGGD